MHIVIPTKSGLPPLEDSFCHFLVADPTMDHAKAYLKCKPTIAQAGARQGGLRLLQDDAVREYLGILLEERQKRLEMDEDWVMRQLRNIHDRCSQSEPVYGVGSKVLDDDGEETGEISPLYYKFDANGALKSLELIGKHMKMFSDKTTAGTTNVQVNINLGVDDNGENKGIINGEFKRVGSN